MSNVDHPAHYQGKVEAIDAIESAMSPEAFQGFLHGNAMKYLCRLGKKGPPLEDGEKAAWYLARLIAHLKAQ